MNFTLWPASRKRRAARDLEVEVVIVRLRAELDLLDLDDGLLALRLARLLLLLVLVLAEVEDLADGRLGLRVHLDEVEALLLRACAAPRGWQHAEHLAVGADDAHLGHADAVVDADLRTALL